MAEIFNEIGPQAVAVIEDKLLSGAHASVIARTLTENGHPVSETTVKTHRKALKEASASE